MRALPMRERWRRASASKTRVAGVWAAERRRGEKARSKRSGGHALNDVLHLGGHDQRLDLAAGDFDGLGIVEGEVCQLAKGVVQDAAGAQERLVGGDVEREGGADGYDEDLRKACIRIAAGGVAHGGPLERLDALVGDEALRGAADNPIIPNAPIFST